MDPTVLSAGVLFGGFVGYAISGYVGSAYLWWKRRRAAEPPAA